MIKAGTMTTTESPPVLEVVRSHVDTEYFYKQITTNILTKFLKSSIIFVKQYKTTQ